MTRSRGIGRGSSTQSGEHHPRAILTAEKVRAMRRMVLDGGTHQQAADWAACSYSAARDAIIGATWLDVDDPPPVRRLRRWTEAELTVLIEHEDAVAPDLAPRLERTANAIRHKRSQQGL